MNQLGRPHYPNTTNQVPKFVGSLVLEKKIWSRVFTICEDGRHPGYLHNFIDPLP